MRARLQKKIGAFLFALIILISAWNVPVLQSKAAAGEPSVTYAVHAQTHGWMAAVKDGATAGTVGEGKRLEAVAISLNTNGCTLSGGLQYSVHVQKNGWMDWVEAGKDVAPSALIAQRRFAGTSGQAKRVEAIRIRLTGELAQQYEVLYRVHMQSYGWCSWTRNGDVAGVTGQAKRMEAVEIRLVRKPSITPTASLTYSVHAQTHGWMASVPEGVTAGTTGEGKRLEALKIRLTTNGVTGGIAYNTHIQGLGWTQEVGNDVVSGTVGEGKRMEAVAIHLTGDISAYYDIYYRVHCQSYGWMDWAKNGELAGTANGKKRMEAIQIRLVSKGAAAPGATTRPYVYIPTPVIDKNTYEIKVNKQQSCITIYKEGVPIKAMACSPGDATPVGTYNLAGKWRWNTLMGGVKGQYCSQIYGNFLFHSVLYNSANPRSLIASSYNNLGKRVSHGCVRLRVADAKWIFDNCPTGTKITIYNSSDPGPLGKPTLSKIPGSQTWDPSDPAIR